MSGKASVLCLPKCACKWLAVGQAHVVSGSPDPDTALDRRSPALAHWETFGRTGGTVGRPATTLLTYAAASAIIMVNHPPGTAADATDAEDRQTARDSDRPRLRHDRRSPRDGPNRRRGGRRLARDRHAADRLARSGANRPDGPRLSRFSGARRLQD